MKPILRKVKTAYRQEAAYARMLLSAPRSFVALPAGDVVVYDDASTSTIHRLLDGVSYSVVHTRGECAHLHPAVLWRVMWFALRFGRLSLAYPAAVIDKIDPSVVVTFMDNDGVFHELATRLPSRRFVAVQNGWRFPDYTYPLKASHAYGSQLFCFGPNDMESYARHGTTFARLEAIGSIKNAMWQLASPDSAASSEGDASSEEDAVDLCIVSQYRYPEPVDLPVWRDVDLFMRDLAEFLAARPALRVAVALGHSEGVTAEEEGLRWETAYFRERLGKDVRLVPNDEEKTSTYRLTDRSAVNVSASSTASMEAAARGRRTVIHLRGDLPEFAQAARPPWLLVAASQTEFAESLDAMLAMSDDDFVASHGEEIGYFMADVAPGRGLQELRDAIRGGRRGSQT